MDRIFTTFTLALAVLAGIFIIDLVTPLDMASWVVYLLVPAVASWWLNRWQTITLAAIDTILMIIGHRFSPPGIGPAIEFLNRLIGVLVLWGVVAILIRHRRTQRTLMESEEEFRSIFELSAVGMTEADVATKRLCRVNRKFCEITGYSQDELRRMRFSDITHPDDRQLDHQLFRRTLHRESSDWTIEKRYLRKNGTIIWVRITGTVIFDAAGRAIRTVGVVQDITEARKAEEEIMVLNATLAERAIELEAANRELEAFSYTVSHDLRKPLTIISASCQMLNEVCGDAFSNECRELIHYIDNGTERMNQLINTLLNLSRVSNIDLQLEATDLSYIANEVVAELKASAPGRKMSIRIYDGVVVSADPKLMRVLLENLLGNAWKYTGTRDEAVIEFGTVEVAGEKVCFVRDNGTGFDMTHVEKLFLPLKRLPGAERYEGFGVGLATVQRIIERHGGRIWAESEPDKGATFYFVLPEGKP